MKQVNERKVLSVLAIIVLANVASFYTMTQIHYVFGFFMMAMSILLDIVFIHAIAAIYEEVERANKERIESADEVYSMQSHA